MSENTKIEWADHTFNPWIGCTKVGPGCDNCYAKADFEDRKHRVTWGAGQARSRTKTWGDPVRWNKQHEAFFAANGRRQRVFCASLADVFDNDVDPQWRVDLFELIAVTPNLDWLLLTKRIGNANAMLNETIETMAHGINDWDCQPWPNVWIGATIVNQEEADRDIHKLLTVRAAKRFLSMEPLLGPIDLDRWLELAGLNTDLGLSNPGLDWVIVGGESGPHARPMHPDWARILRDQCEAAGVPFLFKQWGEWASMKGAGIAEHGPVMDSCGNVTDWMHQEITLSNGSKHQVKAHALTGHATDLMFRVGKKSAGRLLDGREWNGVPA